MKPSPPRSKTKPRPPRLARRRQRAGPRCGDLDERRPLPRYRRRHLDHRNPPTLARPSTGLTSTVERWSHTATGPVAAAPVFSSPAPIPTSSARYEPEDVDCQRRIA
jgi:hypothetical protein